MNSLHREATKVKRQVRRVLCVNEAKEAIGPVEHGAEIFILTKGGFSLIDSLLYLVEVTGPCDLTLGTWTAANSDLAEAHRLLAAGGIRSFRLISDFSFGARQPSYLAAARERFSDGCIRLTKFHGKFATLTNDAWTIAVRTSMNLNRNARFESLEISDDPALCGYLTEIADELFRWQAPGEAFTKRPGELCKDFAKFAEPDADVSEAAIMASTDSQKYFNAGAYQNDLNRTGLTRGR